MRWALVDDEAPTAPELPTVPPVQETVAQNRFHAVMAVENVWTGDGRQFVPDSLSWRDLPLPLMAVDATTYEHLEAVLIGNFDRIERVGSEVHGYGAFIAEPDLEATALIGLVQRGELRGVSADIDDVEFEILLPDEEPMMDGEEFETTDEGQLVVPITEPKMRVTKGRLIGATVLPFPALQECYIELATGEPVTAAAAAIHHTGLSDADWDGAAEEAKLPSPVPLTTARNFYAWIDDDAVDGDAVPKTGGKLPHHHVGDNGAPGLANSAALSAAMATLHGGRGAGPGTDVGIPEADRKAVYDHLAAHYRDNDLEPPEFSLLAAAGVIPLRPPVAWFSDPHLSEPTPLRVTDDGRVWGHAAAWADCHVSFPDRCQPPPRSRTAYAFFRTGEVICADGSSVPVGQICVRGGHADRSLDAAQAMAHYDNTDAAVADVAVGEDRTGIWLAGALRPGVSPADVRVLMASGLSGDWRWIGGNLELIALSSVNVPGFPRPRALLRESGGLVASAIVTFRPVRRPTPPLESTIERIAFSIGRSKAQRIEALRQRVHKEASHGL